MDAWLYAVAWRRTDATLSRPEVMEVLKELRPYQPKQPAGLGGMTPVPIPDLASHQLLIQILEQRIAWRPVHKTQVAPPSPSPFRSLGLALSGACFELAKMGGFISSHLHNMQTLQQSIARAIGPRTPSLTPGPYSLMHLHGRPAATSCCMKLIIAS